MSAEVFRAFWLWALLSISRHVNLCVYMPQAEDLLWHHDVVFGQDSALITWKSQSANWTNVYACQQCRQSNTSQELVVQVSDAYAYDSTSKSESLTAGSRLPPWEAFTIYYLFCSMYGSTAELNGLRLRRLLYSTLSPLCQPCMFKLPQATLSMFAV